MFSTRDRSKVVALLAAVIAGMFVMAIVFRFTPRQAN
jgi:hypothetical protein